MLLLEFEAGADTHVVPEQHSLVELQVVPHGSHVCWQLPLLQISPLEQCFPHAPQLFGLVSVATQTPLHRVSEEGQICLHVPPEHCAEPPVGAEQVWAQLPQLPTEF
jgi:hypothetical protein